MNQGDQGVQMGNCQWEKFGGNFLVYKVQLKSFGGKFFVYKVLWKLLFGGKCSMHKYKRGQIKDEHGLNRLAEER